MLLCESPDRITLRKSVRWFVRFLHTGRISLSFLFSFRLCLFARAIIDTSRSRKQETKKIKEKGKKQRPELRHAISRSSVKVHRVLGVENEPERERPLKY